MRAGAASSAVALWGPQRYLSCWASSGALGSASAAGCGCVCRTPQIRVRKDVTAGWK
jgi:hypothetical protein